MSYNEDVKTLMVFAIGSIEPAGWLIAGITQILWPDSQTDVWSQIEGQVEALIGKEIAQEVYQQVQEDLKGLNAVLLKYQQAVAEWQQNPGSSTAVDGVISQFNATVDLFADNQPHFQAQGYELLLLPLFAQMANLYLAVLRDGVNNAQAWSVPDASGNLGSTISASQSWASQWFGNGYDALPQTGNVVNDWQTRNNYVQQMALGVMDFSHYWTWFDPAKGPPVPLTREIYAPLQATSGNLAGTSIPIDPYGEISSPVNRAPITAISVWGSSQIDGFQLTYGGQPGPVLGTSTQSSDTPPGGWSGPINSSNPIVQVGAYSGANLCSLWFWFLGGGVSNLCGDSSSDSRAGNFAQTFGFPGHVLSSISVFGTSGDSTGSAAFVVFGFRSQDSYSGWTAPPACWSLANGSPALGCPAGLNSPLIFLGVGTDLMALCGPANSLSVVTNTGSAPLLLNLNASVSNLPPVNPALACNSASTASMTTLRWVVFQGWVPWASHPDNHVSLVSQNLEQTTWSPWTCVDLWEQSGCPSGCCNTGPLATFGDDNGPVVTILGADGRLYQLPATGHAFDLTAQVAGAPLPAGDPAATYFPNLYLTVFQGAEDQHIYVLSHDLFLKSWACEDAWAKSGCSILPAPGGRLSITGTQDTGLYVFFRGADNHIYVFSGSPGSWNYVADLSALNPLAPLAAGNPSGALRNGSLRVVYRGPDNFVYKMWFDTSSSQWFWKNLQRSLPNPAPASGDPFCAVFSSFAVAPESETLASLSAEHVLYLGTDGYPYDLCGDSD
jgi:hypothetical protein